MVLKEEDEKLFRELETTTLDKYHKRFSLLARHEPIAIEALLRCYGKIDRDISNVHNQKVNEDQRHHTINQGARGLSHCLRWIKTECPKLLCLPQTDKTTLQNESLELLKWAVMYDPLSNQHRMYSRRKGKEFLGVSIHRSDKEIVFQSKYSPEPQYYVSQCEAARALASEQQEQYPRQQFDQTWKDWYKSATTIERKMFYDDSTIRTSGGLDSVTNWMRQTCLPDCDDEQQLGQFTLGQLRKVLAALHAASLLRIKLEEHFEETENHQTHIETCVFTWHKSELVKWLANITQVDHEQIRSIISLLSFGDEKPHITVAHKPLISCGKDRIFLSPRLFVNLPFTQLAATAINQDKGSRIFYNKASTQIEQDIVRTIYNSIQRGSLSNCPAVIEKRFTLDIGDLIQPDIVVMSEDISICLVIDVKNAIPPLSSGDVANDVNTWHESWQPQISKYINAFKNQPQILAQHFSTNKVPVTFFGIILTRWPFPVPVEFPDNAGAIDWPSLKRELAIGEYSQTIQQLIHWIRTRPDCKNAHSLQWEPRTIPVDNWSYTYSFLQAHPETRTQ